MIPLWMTVMSPVQSWWGWALRSFGRPWVAQRVWARPIAACGVRSAIAVWRLASLPALFSTNRSPSSSTRAMPGRVVAAVLEPPQALDEDRPRLAGPRVADDSAHASAVLLRVPRQRPSRLRPAACRMRQFSRSPASAAIASASSETRSASGPSTMTRSAGSVPGRPDEDPAGLAEPAFGVADRPLEDGVALPLVLVTGLHRPLLLGQERDPGGELGERPCRSGVMTRRTSSAVTIAVAGRRVLEDDDVAALLAAQAGARDLHALEDVLVADRRPDDLAAGRLDDRLEPAVRQHRDDERALPAGRRARAGRGRGRRGPGRRRRRRPAASTAMSRSASPSSANPTSAPRAATSRGERRRGGRAGLDVDVHAVRLVVDDLDRARRSPRGSRARPRRPSRWRSRGRSARPRPSIVRARPEAMRRGSARAGAGVDDRPGRSGRCRRRPAPRSAR